MNSLLQRAGHTGQSLANPKEMRAKLQSCFDTIWNEQRLCSSKLPYYNSLKVTPKIAFEPFLNLHDHESRRSVMKLRSSSHRLNCETARYSTEKDLAKKGVTTAWEKRCEFCTSDEALPFCHLPFYDTIVEDERHVLIACPRFHAPRSVLNEDTKSLLLRNEDQHLLYQPEHIQHFGHFVKRIFKLRFPKKQKRLQKTTNES